MRPGCSGRPEGGRGRQCSGGDFSAPCRQQKMQTEMQENLKIEGQRHADAQEQLERTLRAMQTTKENLQHLANKMNHVKVVGPALERAPPKVSWDLRGSVKLKVSATLAAENPKMSIAPLTRKPLRAHQKPRPTSLVKPSLPTRRLGF